MEKNRDSSHQAEAEESKGSVEAVIVRLGVNSTGRVFRAGQLLNTPVYGEQETPTHAQGLNNHLTWGKIKAGWAEFKQKASNE